jgi:hypothetical protein
MLKRLVTLSMFPMGFGGVGMIAGGINSNKVQRRQQVAEMYRVFSDMFRRASPIICKK